MQAIQWNKTSAEGRVKALARPPQSQDRATADKVEAILRAVRERGDDALRDYSKQFDKVELKELRVPETEIREALEAIDPELRAAMEQAKSNIEKFHEAESSERRRDRNHARRELRIALARDRDCRFLCSWRLGSLIFFGLHAGHPCPHRRMFAHDPLYAAAKRRPCSRGYPRRRPALRH